MPFGLKNAPSVFQRMIDNKVGPLLGSCCIAYMDNILVSPCQKISIKSTWKRLWRPLAHVPWFLSALSPKNFKKKVTFLGRIIFENGRTVCPNKIAAIVNWKRPENWTKLCSFLGTVNFLCCFAPNLSDAAHPLWVMKSTKIPFIWGRVKKMLS